MSKISFKVGKKDISIWMEADESEGKSSDMDGEDSGTNSPFIDRFGNVWTDESIANLAFIQMIRRTYRAK